MAKQHSKRPRRNVSASKHQLNWLWGQSSVMETLKAGRWRVYELFVTPNFSHAEKDFLKASQKEGIEIQVVSPAQLEELTGASDHQEIVARVSKYPYETMAIFDSIKTSAGTSLATTKDILRPTTLQPLVVVVDRVQDAFSFASILRCCANAGVNGVVVGEFCQAQVTTQVARASLGAVNHFPIVQTDNLEMATEQLMRLGLQLVTYDSQGPQSLYSASLTAPTAVLVGSDTLGLATSLQEKCQHRISIPGFGVATPLYSAVAAAILLAETRRQQF